MIVASFGTFGLIWSATPLGAGGLGGILGEGGGDEGRDHPAPALAGMGQDIPLKMHPAALPGRAQDLADRRLDAFVRIRDHQLHAAQSAPGQLARGNSVQIGSASDVPISRPRTSLRPSVFTPTAIMTATEPMRPPRRTLR
jgi:hypothetical protein